MFTLAGTLALLRNLISVIDSFKFRAKVAAALTEVKPRYWPKVAVLIPCKEADPQFRENISSILQQQYGTFSVIFVTGSTQDPAYKELLELTAAENTGATKLVTAGLARRHSQKIHNLLRGLREVAEEAEVLVFADSDIRVRENWLAHLVAPLLKQQVGAATGYRWYLPIAGNFWSAVRSVWNMTSANLLFSDKYNFTWGGSMAIRKETFEVLKIAERWQNGLSDDMILTRAVKQGDYRIEFVPQSLGLSCEQTNWSALLEWTARQMTIVRVYDARLWRLAAWPQWTFNLIFVAGLFLACRGLLLETPIPKAAWVMMSDLPLGALINYIRFSSFMKAMPHYREKMQTFWWAYVGLHLLSSFVMSLSLIKSAAHRRVAWHGIRYEMRSAEETVVLDD
ncbi:MAG: glycosyltransferase [bacterium]